MKKLAAAIRRHLFVILFVLSTLSVAAIAIFAGITMGNSAELLANSSKAKMVALSQAASLLVDAEDLDAYQAPEDMERADYVALKQRLIAFTDRNELAYTYYIRYQPETDDMRFIIDNTPVDYTALAEPPMPREAATDLALTGVPNAMDIGSYSEGWHGYMTAFSPVYNRDGSLSHYVAGVDRMDESIRAEYDSFRLLAIVLSASIFIIFTIGIISIYLYQKKAKQSMAASESKSKFLANMSHEMRTPMNAIIGMTEIARKSDDPERIRDSLEKIDAAALHLLGVINDVLDLSKIEAGKLTLTSAPFALVRAVDNCIGGMRVKADEKHLSLVCDIAPDVPARIVGDQQHLVQVIVNLVSNAIKFTPEGGTVTITVRQEDLTGGVATLRFDVRDTGIGIAPEQRRRLFRSFEQADDSISRRFGGTGLGLAISKRIVEGMHGEISVDSVPGEGSNFWFTVRVLVDDGTADAPDADAPAAPRADNAYAGRRMLLAEDIDINREILIALLESTGIAIDEAENGARAVAMFEATPDAYDIILMDIHMPELDGYAATRAIRALPLPQAAAVPIIAMTANVFREDVEQSLAAGMNGHLGKPIVMDDLLSTLDSYLL